MGFKLGILVRATKVDFWHARPPQQWPLCKRATAAATAFYSAKYSQDLDLGSLASRGGPACTERNIQ